MPRRSSYHSAIREAMGAIIKEKRREKGWTQLDLVAELSLLDPKNRNTHMVSAWERGDAGFGLDTALLLSHLLGFSLDKITKEIICQKSTHKIAKYSQSHSSISPPIT